MYSMYEVPFLGYCLRCKDSLAGHFSKEHIFQLDAFLVEDLLTSRLETDGVEQIIGPTSTSYSEYENRAT